MLTAGTRETKTRVRRERFDVSVMYLNESLLFRFRSNVGERRAHILLHQDCQYCFPKNGILPNRLKSTLRIRKRHLRRDSIWTPSVFIDHCTVHSHFFIGFLREATTTNRSSSGPAVNRASWIDPEMPLWGWRWSLVSASHSRSL